MERTLKNLSGDSGCHSLPVGLEAHLKKMGVLPYPKPKKPLQPPSQAPWRPTPDDPDPPF